MHNLLVKLCCWLCRSFLHKFCHICWLAYPPPPFLFKNVLRVGTLNGTPWAFCCIVLSQSLTAGQEMCWWKCFNNVFSFQYVLLTLLSAGNCWDIDLKKKKNLYCLLILSLQHSILLIVQIKDCAKSSLLMKCSQKTTWLSYNTVNTGNICGLYTLDWPTEQCAQ